MRERYDTLYRSIPQVQCGLSKSWGPLVHIIPHAREVTSVAFSPDGSRIVSGSRDSIVRIWNTATGKQVAELEGHSRRVTSVAFSHRYIASGSGDSTVRLWGATKFQAEHLLEGHLRGVMSVALSCNDRFVLSGSDDMTLRIWDTKTGLLVRELKGHSDMVKSVAFSPDSKLIASGSYQELFIWNTEGVLEYKLRDPGLSWITYVAFSHDGCNIIFPSGFVRIQATGTGLVLKEAMSGAGSAAFSYDDLQIVVGMRGGVVSVLDSSLLHEVSPAYNLGEHSGDVVSVSFSHDNTRIVSGSSDRTVHVWDTWNKKQDREVDSKNVHRRSVTSLAFSRDGGFVASAAMDAAIKIWNVAKGMVEHTLSYHTQGVTSVTFSHDGSIVISGSRGSTIQIWNASTGSIRDIRHVHTQRVTSLAYSHDNHFALGMGDMTVRIWSSECEELNLYRHSAGVSSVAFSWDDSRVVFGSDDTMVRIWNLVTDTIDCEFKGHLLRVTSVAFSRDDSHVISGSPDGTVLIWNVTTNVSIFLAERVQLPDGTRVHSLSNGQFHIYDPIDKEATNEIPPYLLSISPNRDWIVGDQIIRDCWIPPEYRKFSIASVFASTVCLGYPSGRVVILDLKSPQWV